MTGGVKILDKVKLIYNSSASLQDRNWSQNFRVIQNQMSINMAWAALKSAVGAAPVAAAAATQVAAEQVSSTWDVVIQHSAHRTSLTAFQYLYIGEDYASVWR